MAKQLEYKMQLVNEANKEKTLTHGGQFLVCKSGTPVLLSITDTTSSQAAITQPGAISSGAINFQLVDITQTSCDVYLKTDQGYFKVMKNVRPGGVVEIEIDVNELYQFNEIPYDQASMGITAGTEFSTGFNLVKGEAVLPQPMGLNVITTAGTTKTAQFGILSSQSGGNASGFANGVDASTLGVNLTGISNTANVITATTNGALICTFSSTSPGLAYLKPFVATATAITISLTLSSGSSGGQGYIRFASVIPARIE